MNYKLTSVKLWLFLGCITLTTWLLVRGTIQPEHWSSMCEGLFYAYILGNVGTKVSQKLGGKDV